MLLYCNIESDKALDNISYRWYRGQHLLPDNAFDLRISPLTWDSRNNYSCNAYNEAGDGKADTLYLDVKGELKQKCFRFITFISWIIPKWVA